MDSALGSVLTSSLGFSSLGFFSAAFFGAFGCFGAGAAFWTSFTEFVSMYLSTSSFRSFSISNKQCVDNPSHSPGNFPEISRPFATPFLQAHQESVSSDYARKNNARLSTEICSRPRLPRRHPGRYGLFVVFIVRRLGVHGFRNSQTETAVPGTASRTGAGVEREEAEAAL